MIKPQGGGSGRRLVTWLHAIAKVERLDREGQGGF